MNQFCSFFYWNTKKEKEEKKKERTGRKPTYIYTVTLSVVKTKEFAKKQFITELSDKDLDMSVSLRLGVWEPSRHPVKQRSYFDAGHGRGWDDIGVTVMRRSEGGI